MTSLWGNIYERAKNTGGGEKPREKGGGGREGEGGNKKVRAAGGTPHWSRYMPKGTVAQGGPTPEDREKVSDREQEREMAKHRLCPPVPPIASLKGTSVTCGSNTAGDVRSVKW